MRFDTVYQAGLGVGRPQSGPLEGLFPTIMPHLREMPDGVYDRKIAELLAFVSTWTYSDLPTFASVMARRGFLGCDCAALTIGNDPLLVNTSAVVVQSRDQNVVVLSFRGTELRNTVTWMADASVRKEPFASAGYVHGGFHRAVRALWYPLTELLMTLYSKNELCKEMSNLKGYWASACAPATGECNDGTRSAGDGDGADARARDTSARGTTAAPDTLKALYITGHSFGGALAVLAAAIIASDPALKDLRDTLRGIYTFGQPMVGDPAFAEEHGKTIGNKLFRHVYRNDIVARMPPLTVGSFAHLGRQYNSTASGWVYQPRPIRQAITFGASNFIGLSAWLVQHATPINLLRFPFSWGDHMPINYLRTSMLDIPGTEFR
ncbi:lipase family protein [Sorangium sp. So ce834]|uniref:lipase family protein n=1 Tax=Sorangium sp. So ce834 TaxID=3133321 RepID=UPI003F5EBB6B